jgi:hypothetical protein
MNGDAYDGRYAAAMLPLILMVVAYGFTVFPSRVLIASALTVFVACGLVSGIRIMRDERTQAGQVAAVIAAEAHGGDVVVYCPDQLGPAVSRLLGDRPNLVQMTFPNGDRPEFIQWADYDQAVARADPATFAAEVLDRAGDNTVWYVDNPGALNLELGRKCDAVGAALAGQRPGAKPRVEVDPNAGLEFDNLLELPARVP